MTDPIPTVSICIPTYNQTEYLILTLNSVFEQEGVDFEVIISDDSNNDEVFNLVKHYIEKGRKISYHKHSPSLGSPENWNFAIKSANGKYVKILHHDDRFTSSHSLKKFVDLLERNPGVFLVFSGSKVSTSTDKFWINKIDDQTFRQIIKDPSFIYRANLIGAPSAILFKNEKIELFDKNLKWLVDVDFYYRCLLNAKKFYYTSDILIETFLPSTRITNNCLDNKEVEIPENIYFINKHKIKSYKDINQTVEIFIRLNINSAKEIKSYCTGEKIPLNIYLLFAIKKSRLYKYYSLILKYLSYSKV